MTRTTSIAIVLALIVSVPALLLFLAHWSAGESRGLQVGDELPAAKLQTFDGGEVDTLSWRGTSTLLVLFQSTCQACEREIQGLVEIAPSLPGLNVVLLSLDSAPPRIETPFTVCTDPIGEFARKTRKLIVPALYLIDQGGRVVYAGTGRRLPKLEGELFRQRLHSEVP